MYTVGKYMGAGSFSYFFALRGHSRLGVKIRKNNSKIQLEEEIAKAQILRKLGVSVPKYIGIVPVKIPDYFNQTVDKQITEKEILAKNAKNKWWLLKDIVTLAVIKEFAGRVMWGLIIELIDDDIELVSKKRLAYYYKNELDKIAQIKDYSIKVSSDSGGNVLWSQKKAKLYFIDFDEWKIVKL